MPVIVDPAILAGYGRFPSSMDRDWLALVALLKAFQRLGYFPDLYEVPIVVVDHVRGYLALGPEVEAVHDSDRTAERHRAWIRQRVGVVRDMKQARKLAEQAIYEAVRTKDNPADVINVALEELVRAGLELPGYTTLDEMAARIREEGQRRVPRHDPGPDHRNRASATAGAADGERVQPPQPLR